MTQNETPKAASGRLTARQAAAVAALLTGATQEEAATAAGVSRATVARWLHDDEFRRALVAGQANGMAAAARQLVHHLTAAVEAVKGILQDSAAPAAVRLSAARLLLDAAGEYHKMTVTEERLSALEEWQRQYEEHHKPVG